MRAVRTVTGRTDRVVVVGAGLGGLACAVRLAGAGREVTVLEREAGPGGRAGRLSLGGYEFDTGPTVLTMPHLIADALACVDERLEEREGICQRGGFAVREALGQLAAELDARARPVLDQRASPRAQLVEVDAVDVAREPGARKDLLAHRLHERPQGERVAGVDEVDGHAHERRADGAALREARW